MKCNKCGLSNWFEIIAPYGLLFLFVSLGAAILFISIDLIRG